MELPLTSGCRALLCYKISMSNTRGRWVVYERRDGEFVHVSKGFKTRTKAEKERERLQQSLKAKRNSLGVGFLAS